MTGSAVKGDFRPDPELCTKAVLSWFTCLSSWGESVFGPIRAVSTWLEEETRMKRAAALVAILALKSGRRLMGPSASRISFGRDELNSTRP